MEEGKLLSKLLKVTDLRRFPEFGLRRADDEVGVIGDSAALVSRCLLPLKVTYLRRFPEPGLRRADAEVGVFGESAILISRCLLMMCYCLTYYSHHDLGEHLDIW